MERYSLSLRIQSEYGKIGTRKTPNTKTFHAVKMYEWLLDYVNVCFWVILVVIFQALVFKMIISPITSEWSHIFIMAIMLAKLKNLLLTMLKTKKQCLKYAKTPIFSAHWFMLKRQNLNYVVIACKSSYYLGKDWNRNTWYWNLFCAIFFI